MTETQRPPNFPPPPFLGQPYRRPAPPIQLPPLNIPSLTPRHEQQYGSQTPRSLPPIQSSVPTAGLRSRSNTGSAVPLEKLLLSDPRTPPRSESVQSPQYEPTISPRSLISSRLPPTQATERLPPENFQTTKSDPYLTPTEHAPERSFPVLPSPSYTPSYSSGNAPYRISYGAPPIPETPLFVPPVDRPTTSSNTASTTPHQGPSREKTPLNYQLRIRQQPIAARACGFGERDRRVIDPPPIIQLVVTDPKTGATDTDEIRYSLNVVHCTLWNAEGTSEETALMQPDRRTTRRLMGQLVASPCVAKDEHDVEGCFFCFPDLSCRTHGKYRLHFVLMRIDPMNLHVGGFSPILTEVLSDVFTVYTAKDFPGMRPSSALTRVLKLQGCNIQVKKGNERALARRRAISSDDDPEEGAEGDKELGRSSKRRRKE